jgi:type II secretion system protein N
MPEKKTSLWKRIVGYSAFALFSLFATFFLTFPYDALKHRVRIEADRAGYAVRIGKLGPGLLGVKAYDVQVSKGGTTDPPPESLKVEGVTIGPSLFPPGLTVKLSVFGGTISSRISGFGTSRVKVDAEDLDLTKGNLKGFSGIDFGGTIDAHVDLTIPRTAAAAGAPAEPDLSQASGTVTLETRGLAVNGGTANITVPQFGPDPTPFDLPKIVVGELTGKLKIDKGAVTIEDLRSKSPDLELNVTGSLKLAKRLEYSEPNVEVHVKPDPEFQKRLGPLGMALSVIGADPKDPSWRMGRLTGYLGRPQFR